MSTETREYRYTVALEWRGSVEVDVEDGDDEEDARDQALDLAIDDALLSPAAYNLYEYTIERVEVR